MDAFDGFARTVLRILQFLPALVVLFVRVATWEAVVAWSLLSVLAFMLGNSVYSPQWILWVAPLLITTGLWDNLFVVGYEITYCDVPLRLPL